MVKIQLSLYVVKLENYLTEQNHTKYKITKQSHAYIGYTSTYNVEISDSYKPELQLIGVKFAIRSKLIDLLTKLNWKTLNLRQHYF